jgi:biopolymer transport protein TolR
MVAPMLKEGLNLRLPQVAVADRLGQQSLLVEMDRHGVLTLNGKPITMDILTPRILEERAAHPNWPVYFRTDGQNTVQSFSEVVSALRAAGIDNIGLVTETKERQ